MKITVNTTEANIVTIRPAHDTLVRARNIHLTLLHFKMSCFYLFRVLNYLSYLLFNFIAFVFVKTNFKIVILKRHVSHNFNECVNACMPHQSSIKRSV